MSTRARLLLIAVTLVAAIAPASAAMAASGAPRHAVVIAEKSRYGTVLFNGNHRAIYLFTKEQPGSRPACFGACARAWPPVLTRDAPRAGAGAVPSRLGSVSRGDGSRQVTYRGRPLYFYIGDTAPGEITCQDVYEFGGDWLLVAPNGRAVQ